MAKTEPSVHFRSSFLVGLLIVITNHSDERDQVVKAMASSAVLRPEVSSLQGLTAVDRPAASR